MDRKEWAHKLADMNERIDEAEASLKNAKYNEMWNADTEKDKESWRKAQKRLRNRISKLEQERDTWLDEEPIK